MLVLMHSGPAAVSLSSPPSSPLAVPRRPPARHPGEFPELSVIVPSYNEAENIGTFLQALRTELEVSSARGYEVILVDDESPDGTAEIAEAMALDWPELRVARRSGPRGLARAVVHGWRQAHGDVLATINADFQHPPALVPEMLRKIRAADLVVATRYAAEGSVGRFPRHRQLLSTFARNMGTVLAPRVFRRVSDPLSGCFMFRREAIEEIELRPAGFKTLIEILARGRVDRIAEHGYTMQKRRHGKSHVRLRHWFEYIGQLGRIRSHVQRRQC